MSWYISVTFIPQEKRWANSTSFLKYGLFEIIDDLVGCRWEWRQWVAMVPKGCRAIPVSRVQLLNTTSPFLPPVRAASPGPVSAFSSLHTGHRNHH